MVLYKLNKISYKDTKKKSIFEQKSWMNVNFFLMNAQKFLTDGLIKH